MGPPAVALACPGRGDGADHVLARSLPEALPELGASQGPLVRYAPLLAANARGVEGGLEPAAVAAIAAELDAAIAVAGGRPLATARVFRSPELSRALGVTAWAVDETGQVAGSHKARHLAGLALLWKVDEHLGRAAPDRLVIASCGNAAMAASVVARALGRPLDVLVPTDADPALVDQMRALGAVVTACPREPGTDGDPAYAAFRARVAGGAVPFACQGPDCASAVEGGATLAWELAEATGSLDRVFVQVGGGALATSLLAGLASARRYGWLDRLPAVHPVQTAGCAPLARAFDRVAARVAELAGLPVPRERADVAALRRAPDAIGAAMAEARADRARFMWPWTPTPQGVAHGILDDETYDWAAVVEGTLRTGGWPVVVDDALVVEAAELSRAAGVSASPTGAAGLSGALSLARAGHLAPDEQIATLMTGAARAQPPEPR